MPTKKRKASKAPVKKKSRQVHKQAKMAITDKHKLFAMHYALTGVAEDSALKAGFTKSTSHSKSYKWVGQSRNESFYPELYDLVEEIKVTHIQPKLEKQFNITADRVLTELARLGFSDVRQLFNDEGALKPINELTDDVAACVSSVEVEELFDGGGKDKVQIGFTKKIKLWDKKGSLEMLGKHLGIWKENSGLVLPPNVQLIVQSKGEAPHISDG